MRLPELRMIDTETLAMKQAEITRLQQELDQWKPVRIPAEPEQRIRYRAVPESEPSPQPAPMRRQAPTTPPAMKDNFMFGDDRPAF
jgi:hypothetical protein